VTRLFLFFFTFLLLSNCSFSEKSRIWNDKKENIENQKNVKKLFAEEKKTVTEFNSDLKLDLSRLNFKSNIIDNQNNFGSQIYDGINKKIASYKFSKIKDVNYLNYKPLFLNDGLIFFDKKGTVTRYIIMVKLFGKKSLFKSEKNLVQNYILH